MISSRGNIRPLVRMWLPVLILSSGGDPGGGGGEFQGLVLGAWENVVLVDERCASDQREIQIINPALVDC